MWVGSDGLEAAQAAGISTMTPSAAALAAAEEGDYTLMSAESAAYAGSQTGMVPAFVGNGVGATFWGDEFPAVMNSISAGTADGFEITF